MTACIGWFAEPECPIYGWTHGCNKDAPHGNTPHVCACGDWRRSPRRERDDQTAEGSTTGRETPGKLADSYSGPGDACNVPGPGQGRTPRHE